VDPSGKFLYVVRSHVERTKIDIDSDTLGTPETIYTFEQGEGGCTFDAWRNLYRMHFHTGVIRVIDPRRRKMIAAIPAGVVPASNLTFGGVGNTDLLVTAGSPKNKNCPILKANVGVTRFCGHVGAETYPIIRFLDSNDK